MSCASYKVCRRGDWMGSEWVPGEFVMFGQKNTQKRFLKPMLIKIDGRRPPPTPPSSEILLPTKSRVLLESAVRTGQNQKCRNHQAGRLIHDPGQPCQIWRLIWGLRKVRRTRSLLLRGMCTCSGTGMTHYRVVRASRAPAQKFSRWIKYFASEKNSATKKSRVLIIRVCGE